MKKRSKTILIIFCIVNIVCFIIALKLELTDKEVIPVIDKSYDIIETSINNYNIFAAPIIADKHFFICVDKRADLKELYNNFNLTNGNIISLYTEIVNMLFQIKLLIEIDENVINKFNGNERLVVVKDYIAYMNVLAEYNITDSSFGMFVGNTIFTYPKAFLPSLVAHELTHLINSKRIKTLKEAEDEKIASKIEGIYYNVYGR